MEIAIIVGLIVLNGLFSMSEISIVSARKANLISKAKLGDKRAKAALDLANNPDKFLSTVQVGITLIGILTGIYSGDVLAKDFSVILSNIGVPDAHSHLIAQVIIIVIVTYFTIIFGELVPKKIGLSMAEKIGRIIARPMNTLSKMTYPFVWLLSQSSFMVCNLLGIKSSVNKVTEDEIKTMVQEGRADGEVLEVEQHIVERVFSLGDRDLESIMTHRSEITFLEEGMSKDNIYKVVANSPFYIYPVVNNDMEDVVGLVYLKDLFSKIGADNFSIHDVVKPIYYFHENMEVYKALEEMKKHRIKYAAVCDEFGGLQGVVTLKDILEALVGEIPEYHEEPEIIAREDGGWLVDGQCPFYDFLQYFKLGDLYPKNEYNTISGLILELLGRIPHTGEKLEWNKFTIEIVDMDGTRIDKVLVLTHDIPT